MLKGDEPGDGTNNLIKITLSTTIYTPTGSEENVEKLNREHKDKSDELLRIKETSEQQMWLAELENLEQEYGKFRTERLQNSGSEKEKKKVVKKIIKKDKAVDLVMEETIDIELPVKAVKTKKTKE